MKVLGFTLSGKTAFFKKPEVNACVYFTYGNIHKVALLGIFGAILGYGGHTQKYAQINRKGPLTEGFPEFYERLSMLKVSIVPNTEHGIFQKKIQSFNNSVGYASREQGGNLIVKEQWLEEPSWDIFVLLDCEEAEKLCDAIISRRTIYIPYLGKNDHCADILSAQIVECNEISSGEGKIDSLFLKEKAELMVEDDFFNDSEDKSYTFKYEEKLPYQMDAWTNHSILASFIYTNSVMVWENQDVYQVKDKMLMFY